jgi:hypothetical protein
MDPRLDRRPKLSELQKLHALVPDASLVWYEIGVSLQLGDEDDGEYLEGLVSEQDTNKNKLFKILQKWLRDSKHSDYLLKPVTWKNLLEVFNSHSLDVGQIVNYLVGGK